MFDDGFAGLDEFSRNSFVLAHSALLTSESREMLSAVLLARSHDISIRTSQHLVSTCAHY